MESNVDSIYACRSASLNIWNSGNQLNNGNSKIHFLAFRSEYVLRSNDKGWRIQVEINNSDGPYVTREFAVFEKSGNGIWQNKKSETDFSEIEKIKNEIARTRGKVKQRIAEKIYSTNKLLYFSFYGEKWWSQSTSGEALNSEDYSTENLSKFFQTEKSGAWVWIEGATNGIPDSFNLLETRHYGKTKLRERPGYASERDWFYKNYHDPESKLSGGKWIKAEEICKYGKERNISEGQRKNLKIYCSKSKSKN